MVEVITDKSLSKGEAALLRGTLAKQEFAEFAGARDAAEAVPGRTPLELPYAIDGDRIGGLTVKLTFNKVRHVLGPCPLHHTGNRASPLVSISFPGHKPVPASMGASCCLRGDL